MLKFIKIQYYSIRSNLTKLLDKVQDLHHKKVYSGDEN